MMPINKSSSVNDNERWAMSEAESVPLESLATRDRPWLSTEVSSAACASDY